MRFRSGVGTQGSDRWRPRTDHPSLPDAVDRSDRRLPGWPSPEANQHAGVRYSPPPSDAGATTPLPNLHEDRLVGKLDAAADRKASVLRVNAIHEDVKFTRTMAKAVQAELEDVASWLG